MACKARFKIWIYLLITQLIFCVSVAASPLSNDQIAAVRAQAEVRRGAIRQLEAENPFPSPTCDTTGSGQCILGKLNHALALLAGNRNALDIAEGNTEIADVVAALPGAPRFNAEESSGDGEGSAQPFHFMRAGFLYRIVQQYGVAGSSAPGRLTRPTNSQFELYFGFGPRAIAERPMRTPVTYGPPG